MRVWVLLLVLALAATPLAFVVRFHAQSTAVANNAVGSSHVISNVSQSVYNSNVTSGVYVINGYVINGSAPLGIPANNIVPLPPPFGNATSGCADYFIMEYLIKHHLWKPGMPPPILPMICWGPSLPPSVVQGMMSAAHECSSMGYEPLYYGNGYVVCINPKTFQTVSLPIR
jgi:hypothetical protein